MNKLSNPKWSKVCTSSVIFFMAFFLISSMIIQALPKGPEQNKQNKKADPHPDRVKETKVMKGYIMGFIVGDFYHVVIKNEKGKKSTFFLGGPESVGFFLTLQKGKLLDLTVEKVETYLEPAGGYETIERLVAVRSGTLTNDAWWKSELKKAKEEKLVRSYVAKMDEMMISE